MTKVKIDNLCFSYRDHKVLENLSARIGENTITAVTGSSGQGKSTFLTVLNRLWENVDGAGLSGRIQIWFDQGFQDIYHPKTDISRLRRKVAMVFQVPNPLPMSIYKNIAFPLKLKGGIKKKQMEKKVVQALERAFLFEEVKDRLHEDARLLSGGQQQRLCMARSLVLDPEIFLLDEPTSSLDEASGSVIEQLLLELKKKCTILLVSHSSEQVNRIADSRMHLSAGRLAHEPVQSGKGKIT